MSDIKNLQEALAGVYKLNSIKIELTHDNVKKILCIHTKNTIFILKLFPTANHTAQQITYERKLMQHISKNKIDCIPTIASASKKETIYTFGDVTYYGILTQKSNKATYNQSQHKKIQNKLFGQSLFKLHNCPPPKFRHLPDDIIDTYFMRKKINKNTTSPYTEKLNKIINELHLDIDSTPDYKTKNKRCICHGDAWPGNALYSSKNCTLIDFEYARVSDPTFDIATYIWWLMAIDDIPQKLIIWNNFKSGYGPTMDHLINRNTSKFIKINQLRSLVFLHNHILITEELLHYISNQTYRLLNGLNQPCFETDLLTRLWKI